MLVKVTKLLHLCSGGRKPSLESRALSIALSDIEWRAREVFWDY